MGVSNMAQHGKALAGKPEDPSSIPETHKGGERTMRCKSSFDLHAHAVVHTNKQYYKKFGQTWHVPFL